MVNEHEIRTWQEQNLPHFHLDETQVVIAWLVRDGGRPKRLAELYDTPGFENGALRGVVSLLSLHGLVEVARDHRDNRRFLAKPTMRLRRRMRRYLKMLKKMLEEPSRDSGTRPPSLST